MYWDDRQLLMQPITDNYEALQKARRLERDIERLNTDYDLYTYIGNYGEADKTLEKINALNDALNELLVLYDIASYLNI